MGQLNAFSDCLEAKETTNVWRNMGVLIVACLEFEEFWENIVDMLDLRLFKII